MFFSSLTNLELSEVKTTTDTQNPKNPFKNEKNPKKQSKVSPWNRLNLNVINYTKQKGTKTIHLGFLLVINDGGGFNRHQVQAVRWGRIWMVELCGGTTNGEIVGKTKNSDVEDWDAAAKRGAGSIVYLSLTFSFLFPNRSRGLILVSRVSRACF